MKAKKVIIPVSIIAGIALIGGAVAMLSNSASGVAYSETVQIQRKDIEDTVSVNGVIESSDKKNVYSILNYQVESVNVRVGDAVKKGDVLCTINTDELQQQILQQQATVDSSGVNSGYNLSEAEKRYADALDEYNRGENPTVLSAEKSLEQAEKNYNDALADIENSENSLVVNAKKAVDQAEKNLEEAKRQEASGKDTTLPANVRSAASSVENAEMSYENSKKAYEDAENALKPENYPADLRSVKEKLDDAKKRLDIVERDVYNSEIEKAKVEYDEVNDQYHTVMANQEYYDPEYVEELSERVAAAKRNYDEAVSRYDESSLHEEIKTLQTQFDTAIENLEKARDNAKINMDNAKLAYDNALASYDSVIKQNEDAEGNYSAAVKNAEDALETAREDYDTAIRQAGRDLDSLKDAVDQQKENYDIAVRQAESELASLKKAAEQQRTLSGLNDPQVIILENLKNKLEYAEVTAPCDGIITAVNAEEGAAATGVLFTIENIDDLKITASVGEYDIPYVSEGMDTIIKCDALGDEEFDGRVTEVAKTPVSAVSQSGTSYRIEVSIDGDDERLLAGMNARLSIISSRKEGALTITYDALTADENGNDAVYIAEKNDSGTYTARLVPVTVGLETDYEIEVISDELKEGMYVLTDTSAIMDGSTVMIDETGAQSE